MTVGSVPHSMKSNFYLLDFENGVDESVTGVEVKLIR